MVTGVWQNEACFGAGNPFFSFADLQRLFRWWPALLRLWGQFDACKSYQIILSEDCEKIFSAITTQLSSYFVSKWISEPFIKNWFYSTLTANWLNLGISTYPRSFRRIPEPWRIRGIDNRNRLSAGPGSRDGGERSTTARRTYLDLGTL